MGDAQNSIWLFLKNFSNKFSMSDHVNGNGRSRKYYSYDRLQTHEHGDFLSSSNPHLLDIVGKGLDKPTELGKDENTSNKSLQQSQQKEPDVSKISMKTLTTVPGGTPSSSSSLPFLERVGFVSSSAAGKNPESGGRGMRTSKKFIFSSRVTNYQDDNGGNEEHRSDRNEDSDDSNWIECGDDEDGDGNGDDGDSSSDFDEDENTNRCGYCGCDKKYTITKLVD